MHFETATLCRKGRDLWVRAPDGRQCGNASAGLSFALQAVFSSKPLRDRV
jgi:hypothetical protein